MYAVSALNSEPNKILDNMGRPAPGCKNGDGAAWWRTPTFAPWYRICGCENYANQLPLR